MNTEDQLTMAIDALQAIYSASIAATVEAKVAFDAAPSGPRQRLFGGVPLTDQEKAVNSHKAALHAALQRTRGLMFSLETACINAEARIADAD
jgi:hypothetical protein